MVLWLQDVQQELLDVAGGELVDVLRRHVSCTDLQLVLHGLDDPPGDPRCTQTVLTTEFNPTQLTWGGRFVHNYLLFSELFHSSRFLRAKCNFYSQYVTK